MNGSRKFKSLRLVRFGDILYDQQKRLIMLCRSCQRHYICLESFQSHLSKCIGIKHIVASIDELKYDEDKRETRLVNGKQQLFIYEPDAIRTDKSLDIDWEAELEDPRWYTDEDKTLPSKAKALPGNAKENMAKTRTRSQLKHEAEKVQVEPSPPQLPVKRMRHSSPNRTILTNQQQRGKTRSLDLPKESDKTKTNEIIVKNVVDVFSTTTAKTATTLPPPSKPMVSNPSVNLSNGDTQQILNRLRACGVEVKRRNTRETVESSADAEANAKKQKALDIMRKLQSNGIKCTKVNKQT